MKKISFLVASCFLVMTASALASADQLSRQDIAVFCQGSQAVVPPGLLAFVSNSQETSPDMTDPKNQAAAAILSKEPTASLWNTVIQGVDPQSKQADQQLQADLNKLCSE